MGTFEDWMDTIVVVYMTILVVGLVLSIGAVIVGVFKHARGEQWCHHRPDGDSLQESRMR